MSMNAQITPTPQNPAAQRRDDQPASLLFDEPGPRTRRKIHVANFIGSVLLLCLLGAVLYRLANPPMGQNQLSWELWGPALKWEAWADFYLPGLWSTLVASFFAVIGSVVFGVVFGVGRLVRFKPVNIISSIIVEFCRAVPVLMFMIFLWRWFAFADVGDNAAFLGVVCALTLYNGSVIAELVRSGVGNLPQGQREAAFSLGMGPLRSLMSVEVPQALIAMLPAMITQIVIVLKDTALGYIITYPDLLQESLRLGSMYFNVLQALVVASVIYFVFCYLLSRFAEWLPVHMRKRTARVDDLTTDTVNVTEA